MIDTPHASTHDIQFCKRSDHTQRHFINCHLITCLHSSFQSHAVDYLKDIWFTCSRYEKLGNNIFFSSYKQREQKNSGIITLQVIITEKHRKIDCCWTYKKYLLEQNQHPCQNASSLIARRPSTSGLSHNC